MTDQRSTLWHLLRIDPKSFYRIVKSNWKLAEYQLSGLSEIVLCESSHAYWSASKDKPSRICLVNLKVSGVEEQVYFQLDGAGQARLNFTEREAQGIVIALGTVLSQDSMRKFDASSASIDPGFAVLGKPNWLPPRFVWISYCQELPSGEQLSSDYLFDSKKHPYFKKEWLEYPFELLNDLEKEANELLN